MTSACRRNGAVRESEGNDLRASWGCKKAPAAGRDDDVLPTVFTHEGHRTRMSARLERRLPQLVTGFVERTEALVGRGTNENNAACGHDAPADVERARLIEPLGFEFLDDSEWRLPRDRALVYVDRNEFTERGRRAWDLVLGIPESAGCASPRRRANPRNRATLPSGPHLHLSDLPHVCDICEEQIAHGIVRKAAPIRATGR